MERTKTLVPTVCLMISLVFSINWYFNINTYHKQIDISRESLLNPFEAEEIIENYDDSEDYYKTVSSRIIYTKSMIPFVFNKQIVKENYKYYKK